MNKNFSNIDLPVKYFDNVCRVCLSDSKVLIPIKEINFTHCLNMRESLENTSLNTVFIKFCNIEVTEDDMKPQNICELCVNMGCKAFSFFQLFLQSNELLESKISGLEKRTDNFAHTSVPSINKPNTMNQSDLCEVVYNVINSSNCSVENSGYEQVEFQNTGCISTLTSSENNTHQNIKSEIISENYELITVENDELHLDYDFESVSTKSEDNISATERDTQETEHTEEIFTCKFCNIKFEGISEIIKHVKADHPDLTECILCSKEFHTNIRYIYHISSHSANATVCHICCVYFETQEELDDHFDSMEHSTKKCHICGKDFSKTKSALWNLRIHIEKVHFRKRKYQCHICSKMFLYRENMNRHIRSAHLKEMKFLCQHCAKVYTTHHMLKQHMQNSHGVQLRINTTENSYEEKINDQQPWTQCQYCTERFRSTYFFYVHSEQHPEFIQYKCEVCELEYNNLSDLRKHQNKHPQHPCNVCDERFISRSDLLVHRKDYHSNYKNIPKKKKMRCEYCSKEFKSSYYLYVHSMVHPEFKDYKCDWCDSVFDTMKSLNGHMIVHKKYQCMVCSKNFTSNKALKMHSYSHSRTLKCSICNLDMKGNKQRLAIHMNIHTDQRPFVCEICGKGFKQPSHLKTHSYQHGVAKPWKCKECDKAFQYRSVLRDHIRSHTGEKPFPCLYCEKVFRDTTTRLKHIKKSHPDKGKEYALYKEKHLQEEMRRVEKNERNLDSGRETCEEQVKTEENEVEK